MKRLRMVVLTVVVALSPVVSHAQVNDPHCQIDWSLQHDIAVQRYDKCMDSFWGYLPMYCDWSYWQELDQIDQQFYSCVNEAMGRGAMNTPHLATKVSIFAILSVPRI